jgi:hypothetical protein
MLNDFKREQEISMETQDSLLKEKCRRTEQFLIPWNKEYYGLEVKNIKKKKRTQHDFEQRTREFVPGSFSLKF